MNLSRGSAPVIGTSLALASASVAASAYVVYSNTCRGLSVASSFFWFSLIAAGTVACIPSKYFPQPASREKTLTLRETFSNPRRIFLLLTAATAYFCYFFAFLTALQYDRPDTAIIVLATFQIQPMLQVWAATRFIDDKLGNRFWFWGGLLLTITSIFLYEINNRDAVSWNHFSIADRVTILTLLATLCNTYRGTASQYLRIYHRVDRLHLERCTQLIATSAGLFWMLLTTGFIIPSYQQFQGLLYLGIAPTAIGNLLNSYVDDLIGISINSVFGGLKPICAILCGYIPFFLFYNPIAVSSASIIFLGTSCVGIAISLLLGKPQTKS